MAKKGLPMPDDLSTTDQGYYQAVASLTTRYRLGGISAEETVAEIEKIRRSCERGHQMEEDFIRVGKFWQNIEQTATAYRLARNSHVMSIIEDLPEDQKTVVNALLRTCDDFYYKVYGLIPVPDEVNKCDTTA